MGMDEPLLSIGEIAERTNVSRRTVRYYVQRGLIDPPVGLGRSSGYTQKHIDQIQRVLRLQREGVPLRTIEQLPESAELEAPAQQFPRPEVVLRIPLSGGLRLELDAGAEVPSPEILARLVTACERVLYGAKEEPASAQNDESPSTENHINNADDAAEGGDV